MTKYKWSLLGLILSVILFISFLISPLIELLDVLLKPFTVYFGGQPAEAFIEFGKSFYHWNLFWIPIIVFSFMAYNYKKIKK